MGAFSQLFNDNKIYYNNKDNSKQHKLLQTKVNT